MVRGEVHGREGDAVAGDLLDPLRELDRFELELDADRGQVLLDLRHHRVEVDAVDVDGRVGGPAA